MTTRWSSVRRPISPRLTPTWSVSTVPSTSFSWLAICRTRHRPERPGEFPPPAAWDSALGAAIEQVNGDMVRAAAQMLGHLGRHPLGVAGSDERVDEPVAAPTGQVVLREAETKQGVAVVGQAEIRIRQMPAAELARPVAVGLEDRDMRGRDERAVTED